MKENNIIICENCYEENESNKTTCKNCGAKLYKGNMFDEDNKKSSNTTGDMEKICIKCHKKVSKYGFYHKNLCQDCYAKSLGNNKNTGNAELITQIITYIIMALPIVIIIFIIMSISGSVKQDSQRRKDRELREFNSQLHQDPSTWDKKQQDRYDSFMKWDSNNK